MRWVVVACLTHKGAGLEGGESGELDTEGCGKGVGEAKHEGEGKGGYEGCCCSYLQVGS